MSYEISQTHTDTSGNVNHYLGYAPNPIDHGVTVTISADGTIMAVKELVRYYRHSNLVFYANVRIGMYVSDGTKWTQQVCNTNNGWNTNYIAINSEHTSFGEIKLNPTGDYLAIQTSHGGNDWGIKFAYKDANNVWVLSPVVINAGLSKRVIGNPLFSYYGNRFDSGWLSTGTFAYYHSGAWAPYTNVYSMSMFGQYAGTIVNPMISGVTADTNWGNYGDMNYEGDVIAVGNYKRVRLYKYNASYTNTINSSQGPHTENNWEPFGDYIYPEDTGTSSFISISKNFTFQTDSEFYNANQKLRVAIGAHLNDGANGVDSGHVRVYEYDATKTTNVTDQSSSDFGPIGWRRLGQDIDGEAAGDRSGYPVEMNAAGTIVGIRAIFNQDGGVNAGHVRFYKYNSSGNAWEQIGDDLDGDASTNLYMNHTTGFAFSSDGKKLVIGHRHANDGNGLTRTYDIIRQTVPQLPPSKNGFLYEMTSISEDVNDSTMTGTTLTQKRAFTKNAVKDMLAKYSSNLTGDKKIKLKAGNALPGITDATAEDVFLFDARSVANFDKETLLHKTFYLVMDEGTTTVIPTRESTVTITQNANDFTIVSDLGTSTKVAGDTYEYDGLSVILGSVYGSLKNEAILCFQEGTQITCMDETTKQDTQIPIQDIQPGQYVKTYKHGYIQAKHISYRVFENPDHEDIILDRLYVCEPEQYTELTEPLIMTGCHAILVDKITDLQESMMVEQLGKIYVTDDKYRLLTMYDTRAKPYTTKGDHKVWHICLDHYDPEMNYGIYANGLLVESCSERNIKLAKHILKE